MSKHVVVDMNDGDFSEPVSRDQDCFNRKNFKQVKYILQ